MGLRQQAVALLALVTNSKKLGAGVCADAAVRDEYARIKAKKSKLSRARRERVIQIIEQNGGTTRWW